MKVRFCRLSSSQDLMRFPLQRMSEQLGEFDSLSIGVVKLVRALTSRSAHLTQQICRRIETSLHGVRQRFNVSGRHEPSVLTRLYQLRNSGHECADDRPPQRHCLHDDHRKALGEARQHKRPRG